MYFLIYAIRFERASNPRFRMWRLQCYENTTLYKVLLRKYSKSTSKCHHFKFQNSSKEYINLQSAPQNVRNFIMLIYELFWVNNSIRKYARLWNFTSVQAFYVSRKYDTRFYKLPLRRYFGPQAWPARSQNLTLLQHFSCETWTTSVGKKGRREKKAFKESRILLTEK